MKDNSVIGWSLVVNFLLLIFCGVLISFSLDHLEEINLQKKEINLLKNQVNEEQIEKAIICDKKEPLQQFYDGKTVDWAFKHSNKCPKNLCIDIVEYIYTHCSYPKFSLALIARESSLNPFGLSSAGAKGLGQIMWSVWGSELIKNKIAKEERDLYDWKINLEATNYVINCLHSQHNGDWQKILRHYVGGNEKEYIADVLRNVGELTLLENG